MAREVIGEFEARRVERMLRDLWPGLMAADEALTVVGGVVDAGWLSVRWEFANAARTFVYPVEVRIDLKRNDLRERRAIDLAYDFLGAEFEGFLRHGRDPFSGPTWEEVEFAGVTLYTRGQIVREAVEDAATLLLDSDAVARSRPPACGPSDALEGDGRIRQRRSQ